MATDGEVIKEFLVRLGFQVDPNGAKRFMGALTGTTKGAAITSASILGIAVAAELMVKRFASSMEKLFYISKRTDASVQNIQALEYGAQQVGLEAGRATGALEGMSRAMRLNPGLTALLNNLGVRTAGRDKSDVLNDLVTSLSKMPHHVGALYAQMFGVDPDTLLALVQGQKEMQRLKEERIGLNNALGIDAQAAAEASKEYMNSLRSLMTIVGALGDKIAVGLLPAFRQMNGVLTEFLTDMVTGRSDIIAFASAGDFVEMAWRGASDAIRGAAREYSEIEKAGRALKRGDVVGWARHFGKASTGWWNGLFGPSEAEIEVNKQYGPKGQSASGVIRGLGATAAPATSPTGRVPLGIRSNNPGNLRPPGASTGFQQFETPEQGLGAMAGNLLSYYRRGIDTVRGVINRWAPPSENNTASYIAAAAKRMGVDPDAKIDLRDVGTMQKMMDSIIHHENGYNPYSASQIQGAASARIGATINQRTEIHIATTGGAQETASAVAGAQARVMGDVVRNFGGQAVPR